MDQKPAPAAIPVRRPRLDSQPKGDDSTSTCSGRPRFDSIPVSPPLDVDAVTAGDSDNLRLLAEDIGQLTPGRLSGPPKPHLRQQQQQELLQHLQSDFSPFTLSASPPSSAFPFSELSQSLHQPYAPSFPGTCTATSQSQQLTTTNNNNNSTMPPPPVGFRYALIPYREETFTAASWWLVDRAHEPPLTQGATALAEQCLQQYPTWDEAFVRRVLKAYRQFLHLVGVHQDWACRRFVPPPHVEQMWNIHRQNVVAYCHDCMTLCERVVGYTTSDSKMDLLSSSTDRSDRRDFTLQALKEHYGSNFDEELWNFNSNDDDELTSNHNSENPEDVQEAASLRAERLRGASSKEAFTSSGKVVHATITNANCHHNGHAAVKGNDQKFSTASLLPIKHSQPARMATEAVHYHNMGRSRKKTDIPPRASMDSPTESSASTTSADTTIITATNAHQAINLDQQKIGGSDRIDRRHRNELMHSYQDEDCNLIPDLVEHSIANTHDLLPDFSSDQIDSDHTGEIDDGQQVLEGDKQSIAEDEDNESMGRKNAQRVRNDDEDEDRRFNESDDFPDLTICVCFEGDRASRTWFKVRPDTRMGKVFENIPYSKFGVSMGNAKFFLHDRRDKVILPSDTAQKLELQNGDTIDLVLSLEEEDDDESVADEYEGRSEGADSVGVTCPQLRRTNEMEPCRAPQDDGAIFLEPSLLYENASVEEDGCRTVGAGLAVAEHTEQKSPGQDPSPRQNEATPPTASEGDDCLVTKVVALSSEEGVSKGNAEKGQKTKSGQKSKARTAKAGDVASTIGEKSNVDTAKNGKVAKPQVDPMRQAKKLDLTNSHSGNPKNSSKRKEAPKAPPTRSSRRQRKEEPEIASML